MISGVHFILGYVVHGFEHEEFLQIFHAGGGDEVGHGGFQTLGFVGGVEGLSRFGGGRFPVLLDRRQHGREIQRAGHLQPRHVLFRLDGLFRFIFFFILFIFAFVRVGAGVGFILLLLLLLAGRRSWRFVIVVVVGRAADGLDGRRDRLPVRVQVTGQDGLGEDGGRRDAQVGFVHGRRDMRDEGVVLGAGGFQIAQAGPATGAAVGDEDRVAARRHVAHRVALANQFMHGGAIYGHAALRVGADVVQPDPRHHHHRKRRITNIT